MYKKLKLIKMILSTILISLFIINIFKSCSFAMTSDDFDSFVRQGTMFVTYELGNDITNFNVDLGSIYKFINTNYWTNEKSNVPFGSYDCLEVRATEDSNYRYIGIFMWNYATVNINFTATNMNRVDSIMGAMCHIAPVTQVNNVRYINYAINRNSSTNEDWTKTDYGDTGTLWTNPTQSNANTMYLIKNPILNINNYNYIGYNIYNKISVDDSIEIHGIEDIANVRVGSYWATGDITYRLYYMNLDQKVYIDWDYEVQYDTFETYNGRLGTLIAVNIRQNIENNTCYIEMIKNNTQEICTSNRFYLKNVIEQPVVNGSSGQYNASGELIGSIDLSNITEQLQQIESGEKSRFDYWVGFFNPSGDNISSEILNESGDIFGISYRNIDNYGIFDFIHNIFDSIYELLFNNTTNVALNMGMFGNLNSADFTINNSSINTFISSILNPTLIIITLFFYYRFIKLLATLDLSVLEKFDVDNNINLF